MHKRKREAAFSLLELMIALGVAAIIAMFAIPAYRAHVAKAHRLDAVTSVLRAVQSVETARLAQTSENAGVITLSAGLDQAPPNRLPVYRLTVMPESPTNGGYAIEAAPLVPGAMQDDACGTFVV